MIPGLLHRITAPIAARPILILGILGSVIFLLRWLLFPSLGPDDAEQMRFTQVLQWGYSPANPPLYTWMVWLTQRAFGVDHLSLMLVKFGLLAGFIGLTYGWCRQLTQSPALLWAATTVPLLMIGVSWETVRAMSNTVLLLPAISGFLFAFFIYLDPAQGRQRQMAIACGLGIATGLLAKASFALVILACLTAVLSDTVLRKRLWSRSTLLILAIGLLPCLPYWFWLVENAQFVAQQAEQKFGVGEGWVDLGVIPATLAKLLESAVAFFLPFPVIIAAVAALCIWCGRGSTPPAWDDAEVEETVSDHQKRLFTLLGRTTAILGLITVVGLPLSGSVRVSPHHLAPLFLFGPWAVIWLTRRLPHRLLMARIMAASGVLIPLVVIGGLLFEAFASPRFLRHPHFSVDYAPLAAILMESGAGEGSIVTYDYPVVFSGNLRRYFPDTPIASMLDPFGEEGPVIQRPADRQGPCTVIGFGAPSHDYHVEDAPSVIAIKYGARPETTPTVTSLDLPLFNSGGNTIPAVVIQYTDPIGSCR